jgi:microcystin-dependent protein
VTIPIPSSNHNEALAGDTLYSAFLNYEWRQIVLPYIVRGMEEIARTIEDESERQDFEVLYGAMIDDFYNEDTVDGTPLGTIVMFPSDTIPDKWLWCNGQSLDEDDYPDLFALIGHTYGSAGAGFFNLPQTGFRFVLGIDNFSELGDFGGEINHTLTTAEIPAHNHVERTRGGAAGAIATTAGYLANAASPLTTSTSTTADTGGGGAHNNMPPYRRLAYIIKALP